jgi:adenylate cyclase
MPLDEQHIRDEQRVRFGAPPGFMRTFRRAMRALPANPRCKICFAPFTGPGGRVVRMFGFAPSRKNPTFCNACFEKAPLGGREEEIGVLFADLRGYTTLSETMPPEEVRSLLARFYAAATDVLVDANAVIDKLVGDEVMALFVPYFIPPESCVPKMVEAAERLLHAVGYGTAGGPWCPLGIGLDAGRAFVGNIGSGEVKDYTAIGDVVNTASRLQRQAAAGEIVMSKSVYDIARERFPDARHEQMTLKGKAEPVEAWVVDLSGVATPV